MAALTRLCSFIAAFAVSALGARDADTNDETYLEVDAPRHGGKEPDKKEDGHDCKSPIEEAPDHTAQKVELSSQVWAQFTVIQTLRCWNPQDDHTRFEYYKSEEAAVEMLAELRAAVAGDKPLHPAWESRKLSLLGCAGSCLPKHQVATMMKGDVTYLESSQCLEFPYSSYARKDYDVYGCNFFRNSFEPVQELFRCIKPNVEGDVWFNFWRLVAMKAQVQGGVDPPSVADLLGMLRTQAEGIPELGAALDRLDTEAALWKQCKDAWGCKAMTLEERLFEMINNVASNDWSSLSWKHAQVSEQVKETVVFTFMAPATAAEQAKYGDPKGPPRTVEKTLTDESVANILACYQLTDSAHAPLTQGDDVTKRAVLSKEASRCLPTMFDRAAVPGLPVQTLAREPPQWEPGASRVFEDKHPLCGRIALTTISDPFTRARYPALGSKEFLLHVVQPMFSLDHCISGTTGTCRTFAYCWAMWLEYVVGVVAEECGVYKPWMTYLGGAYNASDQRTAELREDRSLRSIDTVAVAAAPARSDSGGSNRAEADQGTGGGGGSPGAGALAAGASEAAVKEQFAQVDEPGTPKTRSAPSSPTSRKK